MPEDRDASGQKRIGGAEIPASSIRETPRTFRPVLALRITAGIAGPICAIASGLQVWLATQAGALHLVAAILLAFPGVLAAAVLTRRVTVRDQHLESASLLGIRTIPWARIRRLDRHRRSFVVETEWGPVSAGWLGERTDLLGLIVERARLARVFDGLPWGVLERYLPRSRPIGFEPHNLRRRGGNSPEDTTDRERKSS